MGGAAIILLLIALAVIVAIAVMAQGTGGFLWWRKTDPRGDQVEGEDPDRRPLHTTPTSPAQQSTEFVGTGDEADRAS
jgi:hypothetical protein